MISGMIPFPSPPEDPKATCAFCLPVESGAKSLTGPDEGGKIFLAKIKQVVVAFVFGGSIPPRRRNANS